MRSRLPGCDKRRRHGAADPVGFVAGELGRFDQIDTKAHGAADPVGFVGRFDQIDTKAWADISTC